MQLKKLLFKTQAKKVKYLLTSKLESDMKFLLRTSMLYNTMSVIAPISLGAIAFILLSKYTNLTYDQSGLIVCFTSLLAVILLIIHNNRQFNKRVDEYHKLAKLTKIPQDTLGGFINPFIRELVIEHNKMKQKKEIS